MNCASGAVSEGRVQGCRRHGDRPAEGCGRCDKAAWGQWIAGLVEPGKWDLFGGLTFDPKRGVCPPPGEQRHGERLRLAPVVGVDRLTGDADPRVRLSSRPLARDVALSRVTWFFREGERRLGRQLSGVVALEFHKNGWPHFHPLISLEGGLQDGDVKVLGPLWTARCGYNRLEPPHSAGAVASYASKYLSKGLDSGDVVFWPERGRLVRPARMALPAGG